MTVSAAKRFTCWGSVRGGCRVAHKTVEASERCIALDNRGCTDRGGYSDRRTRVITEAIVSGNPQRAPGEPLEDEDGQ